MTRVGEDQDRPAGPNDRHDDRDVPDGPPRPTAVRVSAGLAGVIEAFLGGDALIEIVCYEGSRAGPPDAPATLRIRSADAARRVLTAPGELGFGSADVTGDLDVDGDLYAALALGTRRPSPVFRLWWCCCDRPTPPVSGPSPPRPRRRGCGAGDTHPPRWAAIATTTTCPTPATGWSSARR